MCDRKIIYEKICVDYAHLYVEIFNDLGKVENY